jgi:hypothetical protein
MASQSPPLRRPARASKPSRKAQAMTSVSKHATKRTKKRATAQGAKASKKCEVVAPADQDNGVVSDEEPSGAQTGSQPPLPTPPPQGFEYTAL